MRHPLSEALTASGKLVRIVQVAAGRSGNPCGTDSVCSKKAYEYLSDLLLHHGRNRLPFWSAGKTANLCVSREALAAGSRSRTSATLSVQKGLLLGSQNRFEPHTDTAQWSQIYKFFSPSRCHRNPYERSRRFPEHARFPPSLSQHQDRPRTAPAMPLSFRQPPFAVVRQRLRAPRLTC